MKLSPIVGLNVGTTTILYRLIERLPQALTGHDGERQAVATLLEHLFGSGWQLLHHPDGAPYLDGQAGCLSISHCRQGVAIAYDTTINIGVDIESLRPQLERVKERFLSPLDRPGCPEVSPLLAAWTAKEAVYKAARTQDLPLLDGIRLTSPSEATAAGRIYTLHYHLISPTLLLTVASLQPVD